MNIRNIAYAATALAFVGIAAGALFLSGVLTSRATQNASISFDMNTAGNVYTSGADIDPADGFPDLGTNHMTIGAIDNCLATAGAGSAVNHSHIAHLIVQNVEDMVGWQVRVNYIGDKWRVQTNNAIPFADSFTSQNIGFATLPLDAGGVHRDFVPSNSIPAAPLDNTNTSQTALIGGVYNEAQDFAWSADTPQKAVHDEANQTYGTTGGGILAAITIQVLGNESTTGPNGSNPRLFMNADDGTPNPPESVVQVFNGIGLTPLPIPVNQLGDAYHAEGGTQGCTNLPNCTTIECPPDPFLVAGPTATSVAPTATPTATAVAPTATRTATPTGAR